MKNKIIPKYKPYTFVNVLPAEAGEFPHGGFAGETAFGIIAEMGTVTQGVVKYALYIIEDGEVVNKCAWFYETALEAASEQDYEKAIDMAFAYSFGYTNRQKQRKLEKDFHYLVKHWDVIKPELNTDHICAILKQFGKLPDTAGYASRGESGLAALAILDVWCEVGKDLIECVDELHATMNRLTEQKS